MSQAKQVKTSLHRAPAEDGRASPATARCSSRRTFLATTARVALAAFAATPLLPVMRRAQAAEAAAGAGGAAGDADSGMSARFLRLSMFVTGQRDLDPGTGDRFLAALCRGDPDFPTRIGALLSQVDQAKFADMDAFLAATPADAPLRATASAVVSAWYLGIVGDAADAELITYADALMYRPTRDVLAVPTYGPGPLAWGDKPAAA